MEKPNLKNYGLDDMDKYQNDLEAYYNSRDVYLNALSLIQLELIGNRAFILGIDRRIEKTNRLFSRYMIWSISAMSFLLVMVACIFYKILSIAI